jgi:hypothetical protein
MSCQATLVFDKDFDVEGSEELVKCLVRVRFGFLEAEGERQSDWNPCESGNRQRLKMGLNRLSVHQVTFRSRQNSNVAVLI